MYLVYHDGQSWVSPGLDLRSTNRWAMGHSPDDLPWMWVAPSGRSTDKTRSERKALYFPPPCLQSQLSVLFYCCHSYNCLYHECPYWHCAVNLPLSGLEPSFFGASKASHRLKGPCISKNTPGFACQAETAATFSLVDWTTARVSAFLV